MSAHTKPADSPPASLSRGRGTLGRLLRRREASIGIVALALVVVFQILNGAFLTVQNLQVIFQLGAEIVIVAVAEVMVMVLGEIDLSVGNVFAIAPFIMYFSYQAGLPLAVGIGLGLIAGLTAGWINGLLTVRVGVPSFIATLGMLYALNGITLIISGGFPVLTPGHGLIARVMGAATYGPVIWGVLVVLVWHLLLNKTRFGLYTVSVGSNPVGSREVGIQVNRVKILNFVLAGGLAALIGIIEAFRITSIDPLAGGTGLLLQGIAAAVIGGTALTGGSGTVIGAAIGAFVIASLQDGLNLIGVNANTFDLILGVAIAVAMVLNIRMLKARKGSM